MELTDLTWFGHPGLKRHRYQNPFVALREELGRLLDEHMESDRGTRRPGKAAGGNPWSFVPALDVSETADAIHVRAELPGVNPGDVDVSVRNDLLTIAGKKRESTEVSPVRRHSRQCCYGRFSRTVPLGREVDADAARATFRDGVLRVSLPVRSESDRAGTRVPVTAE